MRRIDCHMHFWTLALEPHYSLWMTPAQALLYRDYVPRDALPLMAKNDVNGAVVVAAASSIEEIGYLLGLADGHEFIKGVVGWFDLLAQGAPKQIEAWARFKKLKGIRPYLQDIADDEWILRSDLDPAIRATQECGLRFDALIKPRHILNTIKFIERYPDLPIIIDHMAKPQFDDGGFTTWRRDMEHFRDIRHVHCKISGIVTEDGQGWSFERLLPYFEATFDIFGTERLVFGSDWPIVNLAADYTTWIQTLHKAAMVHFSEQDQRKIWAENGERFYGL